MFKSPTEAFQTDPVWELGTCDLAPFVAYDLASSRYIVDQTVISTGKDIKWLPIATGNKYQDDYYTPENLRAISERPNEGLVR